VSAHTVVLTGAAALVAGAFSMGTGEYVSVTNQNELVHAEVCLERQMLARFPAAEQEELAGGMTVGRLTGQPILRSGVRQLVLGGLAIAVTFGAGSLIGGHGA